MMIKSDRLQKIFKRHEKVVDSYVRERVVTSDICSEFMKLEQELEDTKKELEMYKELYVKRLKN